MIDIFCSRCGERIEISDTKQLGTEIKMDIEPCDCAMCIDCEGYADEVASLKEKIVKLQEKYNELKNKKRKVARIK